MMGSPHRGVGSHQIPEVFLWGLKKTGKSFCVKQHLPAPPSVTP
jgi:hypothetical protein